VQQLPQVQEFIKGVLSEKISSLGSRVIMDVLIASGNQALVDAILAKSLTPQQAELLKQVSLDPQVEAALAQVKDRLLEGVETAGENFQKDVLPEVQQAAIQVTGKFADAIELVIADIPFVGDVMGLAQALSAFLESVENAVNIKQKINQAIAPVQQAMGEVGELTSTLDKAANRVQDAQNAASSAVAGVSNAASSAVAGVSNAASEAESELGSQPPKNENDENKKQQGGSRTRRRIHKLSRRIERTLRRIQKKYGLQDKNSFLRRTLKRR
jgi:hypothetical protein